MLDALHPDAGSQEKRQGRWVTRSGFKSAGKDTSCPNPGLNTWKTFV